MLLLTQKECIPRPRTPTIMTPIASLVVTLGPLLRSRTSRFDMRLDTAKTILASLADTLSINSSRPSGANTPSSTPESYRSAAPRSNRAQMRCRGRLWTSRVRVGLRWFYYKWEVDWAAPLCGKLGLVIERDSRRCGYWGLWIVVDLRR